MENKAFTRSDDVYADAEALTIRYGLHDVGYLAEILLGLEEADYGHTGPATTKTFVRSSEGIELVEAIHTIVDSANVIVAADAANFPGYMELAVADAFGTASARTIASGLRAAAEAKGRDLPLALSAEMVLLLVSPLVEHWHDQSGTRRGDTIVLFVRDALADRWYVPLRILWRAVQQAVLKYDWSVPDLPTDKFF